LAAKTISPIHDKKSEQPTNQQNKNHHQQLQLQLQQTATKTKKKGHLQAS